MVRCNVLSRTRGILILRRVSCVRFSPNVMNPVIVSCGWDKVVKVCFFLA